MKVLRLNVALCGAAKDVVSAVNAFDVDEVTKIDLNLVFLQRSVSPREQLVEKILPRCDPGIDLDLVFQEVGCSPFSPQPSYVSEGEQLVYEIIARSDSEAVDYAIEQFRNFAGDVAVPLSAYASKFFQSGPRKATNGHRMAVPPTHLLDCSRAQQRFDRLLREFAEQRSKELWPELAGNWQKLSATLSELARAREDATRLHAMLADAKPGKEALSGWMLLPLPIGPIVLNGNTIKMKLGRFLAGGVVSLCRRIAELNTGATLSLPKAEEDQMLRYDQLLNMSDRMCLQLSQDQTSPLPLTEFQQKFGWLISAKRKLLKQLKRRLYAVSDQVSYDRRRPEPIAPILPLPAEATKPQEIAKPEAKPVPTEESSTKLCKVKICSATHAVAGDKPLSKTSKLALLGLRIISGENHGERISFSMYDLVSLIRPARKDTPVRKVWYYYKAALERELVGISIDGGPTYYTVHGLRFKDELPFEDLKREFREAIHRQTSWSED